MKQQISLTQYRTIDLAILAVVMLISQVAIHTAATTWFPDQLYTVSPVAVVAVLVMMRWGPWAAIHTVAGGLVFAYISGGSWQHFVIYGVGNAFSLLALIIFKLFHKETVRLSALGTMGFALLTQVLMLLGRAAVAALLGYEFGACLGFVTTDALSILFTVCIAWSIRRIDGLFEDQIHYLLRVQREQSTKGGEQL